MKLVAFHDLLNASKFTDTPELQKAWEDICSAISATDWPHGSGKFTICPLRKGNGVIPIKLPCIDKLVSLGWDDECLPKMSSEVLNCGELDAMKFTSAGPIAFEWETGNISSSHRAVNKLLLTLQVGGLIGAFLVVPK